MSFQCASCGAMSFLEMEVCEICSKAFKSPVNETTIIKKQKISFQEFEALKKKLNRLKYKLHKKNYLSPTGPTARKKLEAEIQTLQDILEANRYLTLLFQPGKEAYSSE